MNKIMIMESLKIAVAAGALAVALTGCCLFCSDKDSCCERRCCCEKKCCEQKKSGMNTSMNVGVGTDGVGVGGAANAGSHGVSGNVGGSVH